MNREQGYYRPPRAAGILRAIVRAFEMTHPGLTDKTAQRYFSEGTVSDESKSYVLKALCEELIDRRLLPDPVGEEPGPENRDEIVEILLIHVRRLIDDWESLLGSIKSIAPRAEQGDLAAFAMLRMVTIDLALRNAALLAVQGKEGSQFTAPEWAQKSGLRDLLRQLQSACDLRRITRHDIADELNATRNTVDGWLDGKSVPSVENLKELAGLFAKSTSHSEPVEVQRLLERTAGMTRLVSRIRVFIGEHRFDRLIERYELYTRKAYQIIRPSPLRVTPPPVNLDLLLMWGSQREDSDYILRRLHDEEQDLLWQVELRSLSRPWFVRIMQVFHSLRRHVLNSEDLPGSIPLESEDVQSMLERVNELGQVPIRSIDFDGSYPPDVRAYFAECALHEAEPEIAIVHLRKAIQEVPSHPGYHQYLGFALEAAGNVDEAIHEYELSLQLDPSDPNPLMYIGMAKYYFGDFESAIDYLSQATEQLGPENETLNLYLGMALREVEKCRTSAK